jgi:hypothetical protein
MWYGPLPVPNPEGQKAYVGPKSPNCLRPKPDLLPAAKLLPIHAACIHLAQDSGLLRSASAVFGLHVAPWLPLGTVSSRAGTIMAASTTFVATLRGRGGHAAFPHQARLPVAFGGPF